LINITNITALILAYLIGSIPSAVWVGRQFYGIDVREYGSGNAGATNTFRVLGKQAGIPVLFMDIAKGFLAVKLATIFGNYPQESQQYVNFKLVLGICALLGHIFPVYVGFRGGKGVATLLGILSAVHPQAAAVCAAVFVFMLVLSHYVSLSSMSAAITYPIAMMFIFHETIPTVNIFAMAISILVLVTHQKNIERLIKGTESRISFRSQKIHTNSD
jgi:glycerol-3-phosphate acyltransferase PlsY